MSDQPLLISVPATQPKRANWSAFAIITDLVEDPSDNGDYRLCVAGDELRSLWNAIEAQEKELVTLRRPLEKSGSLFDLAQAEAAKWANSGPNLTAEEAASWRHVAEIAYTAGVQHGFTQRAEIARAIAQVPEVCPTCGRPLKK